nr:retrovirus-related Pol polyprotein from transposon TNT 1-94 [Tanacetum cinerariifolium]
MDSLSPQVISAAKLPILNPNEFDLWKMRIEQYFLMTDYSLWEVILNGDSLIPTRIVEGVLQPVAPTTAEQRLAQKNKLKACDTLLMALPDKHQLKFNSHKDAKTLMEAIGKRFGGNIETKKVHKTLFKQQFKNFTGSSFEGIVSQNLAFVSSSHTDSTTDSVSDAASVYVVCAKLHVSSLPNVDSLSNAVIYSFITSQSTSPQLDNEDLKQIDVDDLEEMDLRWQMAMLTMRARRFLQKTGKNLSANGPTSMGFDMTKVECFNCHQKGHFARECRSPKDSRRTGAAELQSRTVPVETSTSNALVSQVDGLESVEARLLVYKQNESVFEENMKLLNIEVQLRDNALVTLRKKLEKAEQERDALKLKFQPSGGYHAVPPPITGTFMPPKPDLVFNTAPAAVKIDHHAFNVQLSPTKHEQDLSHTTRPSAPIIEDWVSDSEDASETKAPQGNHKQYASLTHQKPQKHMAPTAMLTQSKPLFNTAIRPVSAAVPRIMVNRPRLTHPIVTKSKSPIRRHITRSPSLKTSNSPPRVTVAQAPVGNPQYALKDKGVINSGCSRHMTGNMSYLSDFEELNGRYVAFGGNPKGGKISGKGKIKTGNLVRGLLIKVFENDNTCVACKKGKQHRASCKTKPVSSVDQPLFRLHIDLFRPTFVKSLNKKSYCLVVTDDYSRFTWVFFLATKDETSPILMTFITGLENQLSLKVKVIRSDNGAEFKNHNLNQFCVLKGIKREFSVPGTPQQNGIAERKNRTLIEAAKTMLEDSLLPIPFWAEAITTACYVQNRVLVTKHHNKTPYELLHGRTPSIGFMRSFGCRVTILNTLDPLGKFEGKVYEGFLVGYSVNSKAFRVFNSRTRIVQETLRVNFLENKPNLVGNQTNPSVGFQDKFNAKKAGEEVDQQYVLFPMWSSGSINSYNYDGDAAFDDKEHDFDAKKPESEVIVSPSRYRDLNAEFEDCSDNIRNEVNVAGSIVPTVGQKFFNSTNTFSAAGPSNAVVSQTYGKSSFIDASQLPDDPDMPELEDITYSDDEDVVGAEADFNNLESSIPEALLQFKMQKVWVLVDLPHGKRAIENGFQRDTIDQTLSIKKQKGDILLVQIYVDDIIFGATNKDLCKSFEKLMKDKFQMSSIGELTFFLGLQSDASEGFNQVIDFLNASYIKYALTLNLDIYVACIKQFWNTVAIKPVNDVTRLQALVDKKKVVITEAAIIEVLRLDEVEGVDCLPNEEIFIELECMGYEKPSTKLTFYKAFFLSQWKFLIHIILQSLSAKRISWNKFSQQWRLQSFACPQEMILLLKEMMLQHNLYHLLPDLLHHHNHLKIFYQHPRVEHLEYDKVAQALDITKLKRRVKKLEKGNWVKVSKLRRLKRVGTSQRVDTSEDTVMDDVSNQGRIIDDLDKDDTVALMDDKEEDKRKKRISMQEDKPAEVQEVLDVVTTAKLITKVVTTASETVSAASIIISATEPQVPAATIIAAPSKDKGKGIMLEEPKPLKKKQQVKMDEEYARKLHVELNKDIDWDVAIDHVKQKAKEDPDNVAGFRLDYFKGMSYDDIRPIFEAKFNSNIEFLLKTKEQMEEEESRALQSINETPTQKAAKRRKLNEEVEDLKRHLEIVPDEDDDVYTEATPLARKVPVVDYEIINLNNKPYYKIIRADGTHQLYISFLTLLKNFDREDLEALCNLVKERFSTSKPNNFSDDFLLNTLREMFEKPDG